MCTYVWIRVGVWLRDLHWMSDPGTTWLEVTKQLSQTMLLQKNRAGNKAPPSQFSCTGKHKL